MAIVLTLIKWSVFVYGHLHYTQYSEECTPRSHADCVGCVLWRRRVPNRKMGGGRIEQEKDGHEFL